MFVYTLQVVSALPLVPFVATVPKEGRAIMDMAMASRISFEADSAHHNHSNRQYTIGNANIYYIYICLYIFAKQSLHLRGSYFVL